jgi:hypothetical protein
MSEDMEEVDESWSMVLGPSTEHTMNDLVARGIITILELSGSPEELRIPGWLVRAGRILAMQESPEVRLPLTYPLYTTEANCDCYMVRIRGYSSQSNKDIVWQFSISIYPHTVVEGQLPEIPFADRIDWSHASSRLEEDLQDQPGNAPRNVHDCCI